ncbi:hypothetical protein CEP88_09470 [Roseobacter denitrificans]|nr:hypothetical protein CEP88_09470 [Roseobacter denitrificans]
MAELDKVQPIRQPRAIPSVFGQHAPFVLSRSLFQKRRALRSQGRDNRAEKPIDFLRIGGNHAFGFVVKIAARFKRRLVVRADQLEKAPLVPLQKLAQIKDGIPQVLSCVRFGVIHFNISFIRRTATAVFQIRLKATARGGRSESVRHMRSNRWAGSPPPFAARTASDR